MALEKQYTIVNGPGKFDLMSALFEKGRHVQFQVKPEKEHQNPWLEVQINSVAAEDGSRESWLIEGGILGDIFGALIEGGWQNFKGYYHSRDRHGWIKF